MKILQLSPLSAGTEHSHLRPATCVRLSHSLELFQNAWHRSQQRQWRDERWSLQARCLKLHWSSGWWRKSHTTTVKRSGSNTSCSTYARSDNNAGTDTFTVLTGSWDKVSPYMRPTQTRRSILLDYLGTAGEFKLTPGTLAVARPVDSGARVFPLRRVTIATKPKNRVTSSSGERRLRKTLPFFQTKTSTSDTHVSSSGKLLLALTLSGSRDSTTSACFSRPATNNTNDFTSSGSSAAYWTSDRGTSGNNNSKSDKSRNSKSMFTKRSTASHLVCHGTRRSSRCQQELSDSYLNCSEKKDIDISHFCAETSKTWASVARLRSHMSSTASGGAAPTQKRYSTFLTTAESKTHRVVEAEATAGAENSLLCSRGAEDNCFPGLKEVTAATVTKKTPSRRTNGAAAADMCIELDNAAGVSRPSVTDTVIFGAAAAGGGGGELILPTAAPGLAAGQEAVTTSSLAASTTAGREEKRSKAKEAAARARDAETLWNTLVPERHWGVRSPMFWVLLVLVLLLHAYNNKKEKEKAVSFTDEDKAERELREEVERRRQERSRRQREKENALKKCIS